MSVQSFDAGVRYRYKLMDTRLTVTESLLQLSCVTLKPSPLTPPGSTVESPSQVFSDRLILDLNHLMRGRL